MRCSFIIFAVLAMRVDGFWMMMKDKDKDGQMMATSSSSNEKDTKRGGRGRKDCVSANDLEKALEKADKAESALEESRQAEKKAQDALEAAQVEALALRQSLQKQSSEIEKSSNAAERMAQMHQDILGELTGINANAEKQFNALQGQIETEMQRQREKLRVDQDAAQRIEELEKEKVGYLGELKALRQLYDRLDRKYDDKMQEEEEEKLAYFAESLDEEVAKIIGEREIEWEKSVNATKVEAEENLSKLRAELEAQAEKQIEALRRARDKEAASLTRMIEDIKQELEKALELANQHESEIKAEHAKELEVAEENTLQRLDKLRKDIEADATKNATQVKKLHDDEVVALRSEITKAQQETKEAWQKSKQIDGDLKLTEEDRQKQKQKYEEMIEEMKKELQEAHDETGYWMRAFAKRAYFNSTQLSEDIVRFAGETKVLASQKVTDTLAQTQKYVNEQTSVLFRSADPYTKPVGDFYRTNVQQHVNAADAATRPIYNKHIVPVLAEARLFLRKKTAELRKNFDDSFEALVSLAKKRCKRSEKDIAAAPSMMRKRLQNVCKDPAVVIRDGLRFIAVIIIILLRKPIWKLIWCTIRMLARAVWYIVSFGFLRSKKSSPGDGVDAETDSENSQANQVVAQ